MHKDIKKKKKRKPEGMLWDFTCQEINTQRGENAVPSSDPNWNYNDPEHIWERDHSLICVKAGLKAAQQKVISYDQGSAIIPEPNENPIAFLERLKETLQKFASLDLDFYDRQVILKDKFPVPVFIRCQDKVTTATVAGLCCLFR